MADNISGIYCVRNILDNKRYVGSAVNLRIRKTAHFSKLKNNKHSNPHLQNAYNKYGYEYFIFEILEYCENKKEILLENEDKWIAFYDATNPEFGYNIRKKAENNLGLKCSDETKKKLSDALQGKNAGENNGMFGKIQSEETIEKRVSKIRGRKNTEETIKKMSNSSSGKNNSQYGKRGEKSPHFGKHFSEESKQKMSDAKKNNITK